MRFWTCTDVERWIAEETRGVVDDGHESVTARALWWLGAMQADAYRDQNQREFTEMVVLGLPKLERKHVTEELQTRHADVEEGPTLTHEQVDAQIEQELIDFWRHS